MSGRARGRLFDITGPKRHLPVTESVVLPPDARDYIMRRRSEPNTFDERLSTEEALITAALENTGPGPRRNLLELKLRQIEAARLIGGWVSPTGVHPPV
jgi:hypothetical protein